jgi:hypothetical protein
LTSSCRAQVSAADGSNKGSYTSGRSRAEGYLNCAAPTDARNAHTGTP